MSKHGNPKAAKVVPIKMSQCPECGRIAQAKWRPFCSKRCANIDLGRWLNESYRIPSSEEPEHDSVLDED